MNTIKRNGLYYLPDTKNPKKEHSLVSVTAVVGETYPKPQLLYWAARVAARAALQDPSITEEQAVSAIGIAKKDGAIRGATVHSLTEAVDNKAQVDIASVPPQFRGYALAHKKFTDDYLPEVLYNEQVVVNFKNGYAGRLDRIYTLRGKTAIVDFKTSPQYYREMGIQLSAYKNAEYMYNSDKKEYAPMVKVDQTMVVLLHDDGTYTVKDTDEPFWVFVYFKEIWLWMNKEKLEKVKIKRAQELKPKAQKEEPLEVVPEV